MTKRKKYETGVLLMRGQPTHKGHIYLIKKALEECDEVYVFLGSADKSGTARNPFPIELRKQILYSSIWDELLEEDEVRVKILTLPDLSNEDSDELIQWGHYLYYNIVSRIGQRHFTIYYSDNPDIMLNWFDDEVKPYIIFEFIERSNVCDGLSATKIRDAIINDDEEYLEQYLTYTVILFASRMKHYLLHNIKDE